VTGGWRKLHNKELHHYGDQMRVEKGTACNTHERSEMIIHSFSLENVKREGLLRDEDFRIILWRTEPFLGNDSETDKTNSRCYTTTARVADIPGPFLGNCSVNMFPRQQRNGVFYVVRAEML
jgi:hypothetical protein